jgi:bromodomain adjacent to zinc finger domain protein 1A
MPVPTPVHCDLPAELFGDAMMVVEFLNNFGSLFELKKVFSNGITLGDVVKAVTEAGMSSTLSDLFVLLLNSVFALQEQEMEEEQELEKDRSSGETRTMFDTNLTI